VRLAHETFIEGAGIVAGPITALWLVVLSPAAREFFLGVLLGRTAWDEQGP
jgi:hypothetical protein